MNLLKSQPLRFGSLPWTSQDTQDLKKAYQEKSLIFWDVDTQHDFMHPPKAPRQGLYVQGAFDIIGKLSILTQLAQKFKIPKVNTLDTHTPNDPEFEIFKAISDSHCVNQTPGWTKIPETDTSPANFTLGVQAQENNLPSQEKVEQLLKEGAVLNIEKNTYSAFTGNTMTAPLFKMFQKAGIKTAVVYGVATDYCVKAAVEGLKKLGIKPIVVEDAVKAVADHCLNTPEDPVYNDVKVISLDALQKSFESQS
jgi:nicotinamidase/pyrazinamidase